MLSILPKAAEFRQSNSEMEEKFLGIYNFVAVAKPAAQVNLGPQLLA
jgi:hypothetical protein